MVVDADFIDCAIPVIAGLILADEQRASVITDRADWGLRGGHGMKDGSIGIVDGQGDLLPTLPGQGDKVPRQIGHRVGDGGGIPHAVHLEIPTQASDVVIILANAVTHIIGGIDFVDDRAPRLRAAIGPDPCADSDRRVGGLQGRRIRYGYTAIDAVKG